MTTITPIILSGGGGTRLWPLSRTHFPKQYWALHTEKTLLQETALRFANQPGFNSPSIICNEEHRFLVAEQLRQVNIQPNPIVLESEARNTGFAISIACLLQTDLEALLLVLPADHVIQKPEAFHGAIEKAKAWALAGKIVTFGIEPSHPNTQYGYIQKGSELTPASDIYHVARFVEKPSIEMAETLLQSSNHYWNSGIFLFKASALLAELERLQPDLVASCKTALQYARQDLDFLRLGPVALTPSKCLSIDYAVMEHTPLAAIVPVNMEWSDVGSWNALWEISQKNAQGNVIIGDVVTQNVSNSYIRTEKQLVSILGLEDVVIVSTQDALLVAHKNYVHQVKEIVQELRQKNRQELDTHTRVYRPWGFYQSIDVGDRFQVKRLMVKPGGKTSIQIHHHRSEHWVVVEGTAKVTRGEDTFLIHENESIYLPMGSKHRVENPGKIPLHFIEVQSGSYLGEDDIVRLEDDYGRVRSGEACNDVN
jgi:mannose-1-phosphate guanylyltransferase/mannose-6-phosphate isomerase